MIGWYDERGTDQPEKWIGKHTLCGGRLYFQNGTASCASTLDELTEPRHVRSSSFCVRWRSAMICADIFNPRGKTDAREQDLEGKSRGCDRTARANVHRALIFCPPGI
jgi:hypothetical protein